MKVHDVMSKTVVTVRDDATLSEAIVTLADSHVTGMPVVDGKDRMVGVLSTSDVLEHLAREAVADPGPVALHRTRVRDLMTPRPRSIAPDADLHEAAQQMLYLSVHRLFVEEGDQLVGVVSQTDLVQALATGRVATTR